MTEKMSWDEIRGEYLDEYVVLVDFEWPEDATEVRGGRVLDHDRDRRAVMARTKVPLQGRSAAVLFTGEVGRGKYRLLISTSGSTSFPESEGEVYDA